MNRLILPFLFACAPLPEGLRATPEGDGPLVVVDWDAKPLPELPFPNDLATRADPTSPTGLRLNLSLVAPTELESEARAKIDELTGFGIYQPITFAFDAPIDLANVIARHVEDGNFADDTVLLIDVTPSSPDFLKTIDLDIGHGRFPQDCAEPDVYFPNDPQAAVPSLIFDTRDEDLDGDGMLDFGEDLDGDGWLDVPNVYPEGGDPREDLLDWYEKLTNTMIVRPAVPLREETTYAVVLTGALTDPLGNPIRSPWAWVNHTRQTRALEPVLETLDRLGLSVDDIGFAWTYSTGRITGDLVDLRRAHDGEGPFAWLAEELPPKITDAVVVHELAGEPNQHLLPTALLTPVLQASGLVPEDAMEPLIGGYAWSAGLVGGHFVSPNLLADRDDGGGNDVDEWWQVDPVSGAVSYRKASIAFTCVIPKEGPGREQPFPVAIWGHGYGSSRIESMLFAWAFQQPGVAVCAMDFPGHGPDLSADDREEISGILEPFGLMPFLEHVEDARYVDTNNDGKKDSGSHQWTADAFHTRDMVRQAVVDWIWLVEALKDCGRGTMKTVDGTAVTCDWDGNGTPDLGADAPILMAGGSLGGINLGVAAAVLPDVSAFLPVVAGGGLMDISTRAPTGGAVEAMHGRLMTPLFHGQPDGYGGLTIYQHVNDFMDMDDLPVATLPAVPAGGRVVVENLVNGEVREIVVPADGRFRVGIPADALDYYEKRVAAGIPDDGPVEGEVYAVADNQGLGDPLLLTVFDASGAIVAEVDTFLADAVHQGVTFAAGSPLVAASPGLGRVRGAPETRRLVQVVAMSTEPGDPIAYARHWFTEPYEALGGKPANVLLMPTVGDMVVAVNSEIALARAAGMIERHERDPRYGMTVDQWLIDRQVVRGLEEFGPYVTVDGAPALFDADDLDNGTDDYGAPSDAPLRVVVETSSGLSGMRIPYVSPSGTHGFGAPDPNLAFDIHTFALQQAARYLSTLGQEIVDDPCLESTSCAWHAGTPPVRR